MKKVLLSSLVVLALGSTSAMAIDGTITINGKLTNATCKVTVDKSTTGDATVTLPTLSVAKLAVAEATAGATNFTMKLTGCSGASKVRAFFEAGADVDASTGRLNNSSESSEVAKNVQIQLRDEADNILAAGNTSQRSNAATPLASGAANLNYSARYYATAAAEAGDVQSSVTYSIDYE
ncbi:fimbrial protein [Citrobacter rodentium]|uniref:Major fimbrial subunit n=3 Tax=Citrobacter rodentium TaxID=67825 RepID=D2TK19_CITRI|nr:fimbrial protein [Citrobacter rodentium]KIQ52711.1 fimbrial protein [Citrobacter rodentium]QBY31597.1 type 1 fimbrial protein [Citrobacter rodentium]UHO33608.1 type 1 fimbrial protein [Citrobacter rodentium NBRC 105723 = DSM 16636]CBG87149.1 putative major fimbrial subunit [Citrobacter rodentium ICC168]HAT8013591.1 type 1 fimbrial protein [Citrobacter rodentium NBRC 105723 = DSM 16636]